MTQWVAVRQGGRLQRPGQRQFGVDEQGKGRLNIGCKSKIMKTKICLLGFFALVTLAIAAPHTWTFQKGGTFEGDYYSSGTTAVVVRKNGTNYIFKFADLSTNDLAYVAKMKADQKQAELDAEIKQMQQAGMVEATASIIRDFPEKVSGIANDRHCWMDAKFLKVDSSYVVNPDFYLGFPVEDRNKDEFSYCRVQKEFLGANFMNGTDYTDKQANPLVGVVMTLKRGDRVRLIGKVLPIPSASSGVFDIEKIEMIETAAEKTAREEAAKNP
jgi:hypothetical protein